MLHCMDLTSNETQNDKKMSTAISSCVPGYYSLLLQNYTHMTAYKPYTVFGNISLLVYHNTCTLYIVTFNVYKS